MPTVEELLKVAEQDLSDKSVIEDANEYLEINPITRQISIPDDELIFGVQHDLDGERKHFKIARYVGNNLDMSKAHIYINYRNANGDLGMYIVTDIVVEEEAVTFSWVLDDVVTAYKGEIQFVICAKWSKQDGTETNRWHTTLATGTSLEGLETDAEEVIKEQYASVLEQLLNLFETNIATEFAYDSKTRCVSLKKNDDGTEGILKVYTDDATAVPSDIKSGKTAYAKGKKITGTRTDQNMSDATVTADKLLSGAIAYNASGKVVGTMPDKANANIAVASKSGATIPKGYYNGSGKVAISGSANIVSGNIKKGVNILGVTGTLEQNTGIDTTDATASASDILTGKTAYVAGSKITGTMANRSSATIKVSKKGTAVGIPNGYYRNSYAAIDNNAVADLVEGNIKKGITILGVTGTLETGSSGGGNSTYNCEAYVISDVSNPTVVMNNTSNLKVYGYAQSSSDKFMFDGNRYANVNYGLGAPTYINATYSISSGQLQGLPSGLLAGVIIVVSGI